MNKTFLYDEHEKLKAKIVEFAGFMMPVYYDSIINEHMAVRKDCGIFDVSHMGEVIVKGADAFDFLQYLVPNNVSKLVNGKILYTPLCNEKGGTVDDILIYRREVNDYLIVVNASNIEKDFAWFKEKAGKFKNLKIENISNDLSMIAVQGPKATDLLQKLGLPASELKYYSFCDTRYKDYNVVLSRTGYTGEQGAEILIPNAGVCELWNDLLEAGKAFGVKPIGLGARDTLRLEVCFSLYGHELGDNISPLEADIGWTVDMSKPDFVGKPALLNNPVQRKLVGFEMVDKAVPRGGYKVFAEGRETGFVTSGSYLPFVGKNMGLALIDKKYAGIGTQLQIQIREKPVNAKVVPKPFYPPFNRRK